MLVSGVQQSESVTHIHIAILFQILFPYRLFILVPILIVEPGLRITVNSKGKKGGKWVRRGKDQRLAFVRYVFLARFGNGALHI